MSDKDVIAVPSNKKFDFKTPKDLVGRALALSRGFYYWGVTELAAEGKLTVEEAENELQCLRMVQAGRADGTIVSHLTLDYYLSEQAFPGSMVSLETPHDSFDRMILLPRSELELYSTIEKVLVKSSTPGKLRKILTEHTDHYKEQLR